MRKDKMYWIGFMLASSPMLVLLLLALAMSIKAVGIINTLVPAIVLLVIATAVWKVINKGVSMMTDSDMNAKYGKEEWARVKTFNKQ